jgi:hypothetical protein
MQQPWKFAEMFGAKNIEFSFVRGPGWHVSMLQQETDLRPQASDLRPRTSDKTQTSSAL